MIAPDPFKSLSLKADFLETNPPFFRPSLHKQGEHASL